MKKLLNLTISLSLALILLISILSTSEALVTDLIAGQHTKVGTVTFSDITLDGKPAIEVVYEITEDDWCITATHLYVGSEPPSTSAPGQFPYKDDNLGCVKSYTYRVLKPTDGDKIYVAAHAVVYGVLWYEADLDWLDEALQDNPVRMDISIPWFLNTAPWVDLNAPAFFEIKILDGSLAGTYDGWCVDLPRTAVPGSYWVIMTSTYDPAAETLVDLPENLDLLNYVMNQNYPYNFASIQTAYWRLIDTYTDGGIFDTVPGVIDSEVDAILEDAYANGEGFIPTCEQMIGIILKPVDLGTQISIIGVYTPCTSVGTDETAWASASFSSEGSADSYRNDNQFKQGWGWYFTYQGPETAEATGSTTGNSDDDNNGKKDKKDKKKK